MAQQPVPASLQEYGRREQLGLRMKTVS